MKEASEYILGETEARIELQTANENREMAQTMVQQGRRSLKILSRDLDAPVYDMALFVEAVSQLVRQNRYATAQILVNDTDAVVKHGHRLVDLCHKLSSFIKIRRLSEVHREYNHAFLVVDERGVIYRTLADRYEAECCFNAPRRARELSQTFQEMWEAGESDPSLIHLHL